MPRIVTLFIPGYTLSYDSGTQTVLNRYFRDRDAENAPAGSGLKGGRPPPPSRLFRHQKADHVSFGVEDHCCVSYAGDDGLRHHDLPAEILHL